MLVGELYVLDLTVSPLPRLVLAAELLPNVDEALDAAADRLFLTGSYGFRVIDLSRGSPPPELGRLAVERGSDSLAAGGRTLFSGVTVIDASDPAAPLRLPDLDPSFGWAMAVGDDLMVSLPPGSAATCHRPPLAVSDIADSSQPRRVGTMAISGYLASLDPTAAFALVATVVGMCPVVQVVDLADPTAPLQRGRWAPDLNPR